MVMLTTKPSRFKPFFAIYGSSETNLKNEWITILVVISGVCRNFFKEVYQNDYHGEFWNRLKKWLMVIKKNRSYHSTTPLENHWWASYHDQTFYSKKWFMVSFFWFFWKMRFFYLINSSDGVKKLSKKQQYSEKFFSEILIIYQYFNLMEYLDLIERVTIDE